MILLITGSLDGTSDRLVSELGQDVFRLNYDLLLDYTIHFDPTSWSITNPAGARIDSDTVTTALWWKAFNSFMVDTDALVVAECQYMLRELYAWCVRRGLAVGNAPSMEKTLGKLNVLDIAAGYFRTPKSVFTIGTGGAPYANAFRSGSAAAKALSSAISDDGRVLFTTEVSLRHTAPAYPWFFQETIDASDDVTALIIGTSIRAFRRSRRDLEGLDWRASQDLTSMNDEWSAFPLSAGQMDAMQAFRKEIGVQWGRIDFLLERASNELVFLEFNPNGQWVFLDFSGSYGLVDQVANHLRVDRRARSAVG